MDEFNVWLKKYREARGWKITFITHLLGVPYQAWLRWEKGESVPPAYWQSMLRYRLENLKLTEDE